MHPPGEDIVCEHCGARLSVDLDFCMECGGDRTGRPQGTAPTTPASGAAPTPMTGALPPPPVPGSPVVMNRGRITLGLLVGVVGLIMAVAAIASMSWFVVESTEDVSDVLFGLREIEFKYEDWDGSTGEYTRSYAQLEEELQDEELEMRGVAGFTFWSLVIGLALAGMFVLFVLLAMISVLRGKLTWLPVLTGMIAGVLLIVAAAYFGAAFQGALEEDMDVKLADQENTDYGLGGPWYLALFGGIMLLLGAFLTRVQPAHSVQPIPMRQG